MQIKYGDQFHKPLLFVVFRQMTDVKTRSIVHSPSLEVNKLVRPYPEQDESSSHLYNPFLSGAF